MATHKTKKVMLTGILTDNPVLRQILGICSSLAVTNLMLNSLIMGIALTLVTAFSSLIISAIRTMVPKHIRMIVQTFIIAALVIVVDVLLKAYYNPMSQMLGPYVGLIITNCIIMGRAEAFAQNNPPLLSFMDGLANGIGYTIVLLLISFVRELLGFGSVFGINVLGAGWTAWTLMIMPPGAFFMLGILIWINNSRKGAEEGGSN
ncbi:MAG TPA: NADH:ubiquinone reductase (Na(+)-transporting) subunit D [Tissierellia bacterium]|nr:NADH:ubiquinone reductase (Na(+)-transporting) subunit D [Tissierellia bacterium]